MSSRSTCGTWRRTHWTTAEIAVRFLRCRGESVMVAVQANDLARARAVNDAMFPIAQALYAPPFVDMHNRMKECLALLGRIEKAVVRPPLMKLSAREIAGLRRALRAARVTRAVWTPAER